MRNWLDVPYADKDQAKANGARWDQTARRWYAPIPDMPGLEKWAARDPIPDVLPGEDRSFGQGLFVDLVPTSCWFTNVRSCVSQQDWERLRNMVTTRSGRVCEICGAQEDRQAKRWMEVHERWDYDRARGVQSLRRLICLCTDCHTVTHIGLAGIQGRGEQAMTHLMAVTGMDRALADRHVTEAFSLWKARSARTWELDLSLLTGIGVTIAKPDSPAERQRLGGTTTAERRRGGQRGDVR